MVGNFEKCSVENSVFNAIIINEDSMGALYKESFILPSSEKINDSDLKCLIHIPNLTPGLARFSRLPSLDIKVIWANWMITDDYVCQNKKLKQYYLFSLISVNSPWVCLKKQHHKL